MRKALIVASLAVLVAPVSVHADEKGQVIRAGELTTSDESAGWARWANVLQKRPALFAIGATLLR